MVFLLPLLLAASLVDSTPLASILPLLRLIGILLNILTNPLIQIPLFESIWHLSLFCS